MGLGKRRGKLTEGGKGQVNQLKAFSCFVVRDLGNQGRIYVFAQKLLGLGQQQERSIEVDGVVDAYFR